MRSDALTVELRRRRGQPLIDEPAHRLAILKDKRHFMTPHLQHRAAALAARLGHAEAWIEETGIMHTELAHHRVEGLHLRRIGWRHAYGLLGGEDIKFAGIEDEPLLRRSQ